MTTNQNAAIDVGLHDGVTSARYHADCCVEPSLSSSIAADIITRSPLHARLRHPRLNPCAVGVEETESMSFGSVVHELALGRGGGFAVWEGDTWRGGLAQAFKENAAIKGQTAIKAADFARANAVVAAVHRQLIDMGLAYILEEGKSEQVAIWKRGGHWMRAMFDRWIPERGEIWDIKTTGKSAHPEQISRIVPTMNYDLRSEFYLMGAEAVTGIPAKKGGLGYQFLFVETEEPFCVTPCYLDQPLRERGRRRANQAMDKWAECMESGVWPGYVNGPQELNAPGWIDYEIEASEITTSGARIL